MGAVADLCLAWPAPFARLMGSRNHTAQKPLQYRSICRKIHRIRRRHPPGSSPYRILPRATMAQASSGVRISPFPINTGIFTAIPDRGNPLPPGLSTTSARGFEHAKPVFRRATCSLPLPSSPIRRKRCCRHSSRRETSRCDRDRRPHHLKDLPDACNP